MARASSRNSVCSTITTASAPRGMTPPVAIGVAVPAATVSDGAAPQARISRLSVRRRGRAALAPSVSAARRAKPSTRARSKGGTSMGEATSRASTRPRDSARGRVSAGSEACGTAARKAASASSRLITVKNCSCRAAAARRRANSISRSAITAAPSRPRCPRDNLPAPAAPVRLRPPRSIAATAVRPHRAARSPIHGNG